MAAAQKPSQQQLSAPDRPSDRGAFARCIVGNHALVLLERAPGDIALVLILEQHVPLGQWAPQAALDALATILDGHLARRASKGIRPGMDRVRQDIVDGVVERQLPDDAAPLRRFMRFDGQGDALVTQPDVNLTNALEFGKFGKHQF